MFYKFFPTCDKVTKMCFIFFRKFFTREIAFFHKNLTWKSQNPQDSVISSALSEIEVLFHKKNHFELNWIQLT